ncbi:MAG: hypothetical protein ACYS80_26250 [Planctomycetota bacterium]
MVITPSITSPSFRAALLGYYALDYVSVVHDDFVGTATGHHGP